MEITQLEKKICKEEFIKKYQKVPVDEYQNNTSENPLVSICVQTYQHEAYIGECLNGLVTQKTNFDFEILLGEDDSSDGTRDICIKYANEHPDKIKLFLHSRENNIKIYGIPTGKFNIEYNIYNAKGKYLAICEGDDFWTDPLKLQKQVDFLEANQDYLLIYSDAALIGKKNTERNEDEVLESQKKRQLRIKDLYKSGDIFWELLEKNLINTLTVCVKTNLILDYLDKFSEEEYAYDHRQWLHVACYGKIKYVNEQWASYRAHDQGISKSTGFFDKRSPLVKQSALVHYMSIINYDSKLMDKRIFSKVTYNLIKDKHLSKKEKEPIITLLKKHPKFLVYILNWRLKRLLNRITSSINFA